MSKNHLTVVIKYQSRCNDIYFHLDSFKWIQVQLDLQHNMCLHTTNFYCYCNTNTNNSTSTSKHKVTICTSSILQKFNKLRYE